MSETFLCASGKCMVSFTVNNDAEDTAEAFCSQATGKILVVSVLRASSHQARAAAWSCLGAAELAGCCWFS